MILLSICSILSVTSVKKKYALWLHTHTTDTKRRFLLTIQFQFALVQREAYENSAVLSSSRSWSTNRPVILRLYLDLLFVLTKEQKRFFLTAVPQQKSMTDRNPWFTTKQSNCSAKPVQLNTNTGSLEQWPAPYNSTWDKSNIFS